MGWTSIAMSMEPETSPLPGAMCEPDAISNMSELESNRESIFDASPCYCPYCRSVVDAAHPRNTSSLASIDIYSVPVEGDVLHAPCRSN